MVFCRICGLITRRETETGKVVFICNCGETKEGTPEDARIMGGVFSEGETAEMYQTVIDGAANDRVNQMVRKDCPKCRRDYMCQIRVGSAEIVVYACKCGYTTK